MTKGTSSNRPAFLLIVGFLLLIILFVIIIKVLSQSPNDSNSTIQDISSIPELSLSYNLERSVEFDFENDTEIRAASNLNQYRLLVSKSDLFQETKEISMTPIQNVSNLPEGLEFIAGVEIDAEEAKLLNPVDLVINISPEATYTNIIGFAYNEDGDYYFFPFTENDRAITLKITKLGGYGVLSGDISNAGNFRSEDYFEEKLSFLGELNYSARMRDNFNGGFNEEERSTVISVLQDWYKDYLSFSLTSGFERNQTFSEIYNEYLTWQSLIFINKLEIELNSEIIQSREYFNTLTDNAGLDFYYKCKEENDLNQINNLLDLLKIISKSEEDSTLKKDDALLYLSNCATFKLSFDSSIENLTNDIQSNLRETGEASIRLDEELSNYIGVGTHQLIEYNIIDSSTNECESDFVKSNELIVEKGNIDFGKDISISFDIQINSENEQELSCIEQNLVNIPNTKIHFWLQNFEILHSNELINANHEEELKLYNISDWEYLGEGELVAKKEYNQEDGKVKESTIFTLIHTPE